MTGYAVKPGLSQMKPALEHHLGGGDDEKHRTHQRIEAEEGQPMV